MPITPPPLIPNLPPAPQRHQMPVDYAITADTWASAWGDLTGQVNGLTDWMNGVGLLAMQYSSETEQWRNETLGYRNAAQTSATNAAASEVAAKKHLDDTRELINNFDVTGDLPAASIKNAPLVVATDQGGVRFSDRALNNGAGVRPALRFDFANQGYLDPRINFTRASKDWDWGGKEYGVDEPVLTDKGLWVSGARTNLMVRSEDLSGWVRSGRPSTLTLGYAASPIGLGSAALFMGEQGELGSVYISRGQNSTSYEAGKSYVASFFVKFQPQQDESSRIEVRLHGAAFGDTAATVLYYDGTVEVTGTAIKGGAEPVGGGFVRLWVSATATQDVITWSPLLYYFSENSSDGIVISNPDLKEGVSLTPYIPTEGSQVTVANSALNSIETDRLRSVVIDLELLRNVSDSNTLYILSWGRNRTGGIPSNGIMIWANNATQIQARVYNSGSFVSQNITCAWEDLRRLGVSIHGNKVIFAANGLTAEIQTSEDVLSKANFANLYPVNTNQSKYRWLKSAAFYERALTAEQLQELTSCALKEDVPDILTMDATIYAGSANEILNILDV